MLVATTTPTAVLGAASHASKQAFAYLRVSGKSQVDGDGFPRQLQAVTSYAAAHQLSVSQVFEDKGVTGSMDGMDRPAWVEMISKCRRGDLVIIEGLDRLARSQGIQEYILLDLRRRGVRIESTKEPDLESEDPTRIMFRQIIGAVAEYDKRMMVLKLRGARQRKRQAGGKADGAYPYGVTAGEAKVLSRMLSERSAGAKVIAERLNRDGIRPRRGVRWHTTAVRRILARAAVVA
jgi:DNA invertase Pin-like site-specific DNA recombinase